MRPLPVVAVAATLSLVGVLGCSSGPARQAVPVEARAAVGTSPVTAPAPAPASPDEAALADGAVRLRATVYEIRVAPERVAEFDADRLAAVDFAKYPPELGEARALYVIDQHVKLAGEEITVGSQEPLVTHSRVNARGERLNMMRYQTVGAVVKFQAERANSRQLRVTTDIELATKTDSAAEAAPGVAAPATRRTTMSLDGPVELGRPTILVGADASSRDKDGQAVVYVTRLVLGGVDGGGK